MRTTIQTDRAPAAVGPYSQAVRMEGWVYTAGQIPLDPGTMQRVGDDMRGQIIQVFDNLSAVAKAAGGSLQDIVKLTIYLIDLQNFALLNEIMSGYFLPP